MPGKELQTSALVEHALSHNKQVFVPFIYRSADGKGSNMEMLQLESKNDLNSLQPDKWGIPSLDPATISSRLNCFCGHGLSNESEISAPLDMVFMPGVAFDTSLARLGHGKGYYDRFLQQYQAIVRDGSDKKMPTLGTYCTFPDRTRL